MAARARGVRDVTAPWPGEDPTLCRGPARIYQLGLRADRRGVRAGGRDVTVLTRPDGVAYTGADFDGEGLVVERGGRTVLASSEREPSIRRFRLADGRELASLPIPGFSAVIAARPGDTPGRRLLAMPDNGFGAKTNSADFLLRAYEIEPQPRSRQVRVKGFVSFREPGNDGRIPGRADDTELIVIDVPGLR